MHFKKKLMRTYSVLAIALILTTGLILRFYILSSYEDREKVFLRGLSQSMSGQTDELIKPMEFLTSMLLSNEDDLSAISAMARVDRNTLSGQYYLNNAKFSLGKSLYSYTALKDVARISVLNNSGDFLTSDYHFQNIRDGEIRIKKIGWTSDAKARKGEFLLLPPHRDEWVVSGGNNVFSLVSSVQGLDTYIEIQQYTDRLKKIYEIPEYPYVRVFAITDRSEAFWSSGYSGAEQEHFLTLGKTLPDGISIQKDPVSGENDIVSVTASSYSGIKLMVIEDTANSARFASQSTMISWLVCGLIMLLSLVYLYVSTSRLTGPIRDLKEQMEKTELSNLENDFEISNTNDEIKAITNAYQHLLARLNESFLREKKMENLQVQANFNSLQAQVNPHFMYNILNVLSNRGMVDGDEEICEICSGIAAMLRYTTDEQSRYASIQQEIGYMENYLYLLKSRYQHRLSYTVEVEEAIWECRLPKMVLQQLVENSVSHGFNQTAVPMKIQVRGFKEGDWWFIRVHDNGEGFSGKALQDFEKNKETVRRDLLDRHQHIEMKFGGLGLMNIYSRMILLYDDDFVFRCGNTGTGAEVVIGAQIREIAGDEACIPLS